MQNADKPIQNQQVTSRQWWSDRRDHYNIGLIVAGILAFFTYAIVGSLLFANDIGFEITIFTTAFQGFGYMIMMVVANLLYSLGSFVDRMFNKTNDESFRQRLFILGCLFSFSLPFLVPVMLIVVYYVGG